MVVQYIKAEINSIMKRNWGKLQKEWDKRNKLLKNSIKSRDEGNIQN